MRRTKIVATVGPASRSREQLKALVEAGVDVFRLNLAHGTPSEHAETVANIRAASEVVARTVGVLADLPGPKMRTGAIANDEAHLEPGDRFVLTGTDRVGDEDCACTTVENLAHLTAVGSEIYLADGEIVLSVVAIEGEDVVTEVLRGGVLRSRKGMHLPGAERMVEAFTPQDEVALAHALKMKVDLVGLSFVRDSEDVRRAKEALPKRGQRPLMVAKIETRTAVENLDEILSAADAVMVARGDLGIQMPLKDVPMLQKEIIRSANLRGKPVITATQMLESMTRSPLPTRAEVADVANAVLDNTDALMLSEETAVGRHPVGVVEQMAVIADTADLAGREDRTPPLRSHMGDDRVSWAVAHAAVQAAEHLEVAAILCPTRSGSTLFRVASFRPTMPIVALSERSEVLRPLTLVWGVTPIQVDPAPEDLTAEADVERAWRAALRCGIVQRGDHVAVVAGSPGRRAGRTDYVRLVRVD